MKLDIKSFIIGILTTVNLFLIMGFDDHDEENQNGRYQVIIVIKVTNIGMTLATEIKLQLVQNLTDIFYLKKKAEWKRFLKKNIN